MDAPQKPGQNHSGQNNGKKTQLSWSQPLTPIKPAQQRPIGSSEPRPAVASASATVGKAPQSSSSESHLVRNLVIAAAAIFIVIGIAWAIKNRDNSSTDAKLPSNVTPSGTTGALSGTVASSGASSANTQTSFPSGALAVPSPQNAGFEVAVSNIAVQVPTWVVIYENYNGQPGNVLGAGLFTKERSSGAVDLLRGTLPGQSYFAGEARDDGDHMFSMVNDPAIRDSSGNPITLKFETK